MCAAWWIVRYRTKPVLFCFKHSGWLPLETPSDELDQQLGDAHDIDPAEARKAEVNKETETARAPLSRGSTPSSLNQVSSPAHHQFVTPNLLRSTAPLAVMTTRKLSWMMELDCWGDLHVSSISAPRRLRADSRLPYPAAALVCTQASVPYSLISPEPFRSVLDLEQVSVTSSQKTKDFCLFCFFQLFLSRTLISSAPRSHLDHLPRSRPLT